MIVSFCGPADYLELDGHRETILAALEEHVGDSFAQLFFSCRGHFDIFGVVCGKEFQKTHPRTELVGITPWFSYDLDQNETILYTFFYDRVLDPPLDPIPYEKALARRAEWIAEQSDLVIAYVDAEHEQDFPALRCAKALGKRIINLASSKRS